MLNVFLILPAVFRIYSNSPLILSMYITSNPVISLMIVSDMLSIGLSFLL